MIKIKQQMIAIGIVTFAIIFLSATVRTAAEPHRLRILSDNIHHGEGIDAKLDLKRNARVLDEPVASDYQAILGVLELQSP